jgi:hypothetical protein
MQYTQGLWLEKVASPHAYLCVRVRNAWKEVIVRN